MGFQPDAALGTLFFAAWSSVGNLESYYPQDHPGGWTIMHIRLNNNQGTGGSWNHLTRHDRDAFTGPRFFLRKLWITSFPGQRAIIRWMGYQFDVWHSWQEWRCELMTRLDKFQTWNLSFFRRILKLSWSMFTHVYTLAGTAATVWYSGRTKGRSPGKGSITVEVRSHDLRVCRLVEMHNYSSASWLFWW